MKKLTTCLWFDTEAEAAAKFYVKVFKNSKIEKLARYPADTHGKKAGEVMTVYFTLDGNRFLGLNGGPLFKLSEAVSFVIDCKTQKEVDYYWKKLTAGGGKPSACGWLTDKFGVSWQVTPVQLVKLTTSKDKAQNARVMDAMMKMGKIVIKDLEKAAKT
jgi:predicted 3-demethylubiquinone-9 3-methyltransferase (glyoxalase superfamily)